MHVEIRQNTKKWPKMKKKLQHCSYILEQKNKTTTTEIKVMLKVNTKEIFWKCVGHEGNKIKWTRVKK
jgi:hypothetical protein